MVGKIKIGLAGFGCVGQGLYNIIDKESLPLEVVKICVKDKEKDRSLPDHHFTFQFQELVDDPDIKVIVELIDDADAAFKMVKKALIAGKKVVTANKKMVAEKLEELMTLRENGGQLWYEAAVCGSIPIVNTMDQFYNHEPIHEISGIFNGSSNYILSQIENEGLDYQQALTQAQELGFAESDPLLDVGGYDTMNKLVILLCHAFGLTTSPSNLCTIGIQNLKSEDLEFANKLGFNIKLVARAVRENDQVSAYVMPCFVDSEHALSNVNNEFNAVLVKGKYTDDHLFTGKGAGGAPTAASVIADIYATVNQKDYDYYKWNGSNSTFYNYEVSLPVYMRYNSKEDLDEFGFEHIWSEGRYDQGGYVLGRISLKNLWSLNSYIEEHTITVIGAGLLQDPVTQTKKSRKETIVL